MHPTMINIFSLPIPSYGLMLALSFLLGIWIATRRAKKMGLDPDAVADMSFYLIISSIVGSRLYYVILNFDEFRGNLLAIINPFHGGSLGIGGLVMFGGFIGAILAGFIFFKLKKLPFLPYADACAPSVGIGVFLTRIGCFLNGCCYGTIARIGSTFSVTYPQTSPASAAWHHQHSIGAHGLQPSQLYESAGGLVMALILFWVGTKKPFTGLQFYLTIIMYSVLRFFVELTRYYSASEKIGPLTHNQVISIFFVLLGSALILRHYLKKENDNQPDQNQTPEPAEEPVQAVTDKK
ncbi:Prolipoprotein diacylglyceryl transferase [Chitinispirillum alkaliphilum]|nr:Prolipoprotein diacylglyceryl transferase [Chitinispirillum alkaliphilum]